MDTTAAQQVAAEVRAALARHRLSQRDLASATGKSQAYWSRRMTGETALDVVDLSALAAFTHVPVAQLVAPLDQVGEANGS
ncbi:MAG: helix-turn-helix domain-containing protein [Promicromonosporaceae bacterium]|nr:helix-turn-helix domain-containing protein [Promicromonosporaceae bacterium]